MQGGMKGLLSVLAPLQEGDSHSLLNWQGAMKSVSPNLGMESSRGLSLLGGVQGHNIWENGIMNNLMKIAHNAHSSIFYPIP